MTASVTLAAQPNEATPSLASGANGSDTHCTWLLPRPSAPNWPRPVLSPV